MDWPEPAWFLAGLFLLTFAGALLPIRVERREDHIILTITAAVQAALLGERSLFLLWTAIACATPIVVLARRYRGRNRGELRSLSASLRPAAWLLVSGLSCTVGFFAANTVYVGILDREYPMTLDTTANILLAGGVGFVAWIGAMSMRVLSQKAISGAVTGRAMDPFDSVILPYVLPLLGGFPLITASVALYRPAEPFGALFILWWCLPIYVATALDLRKRQLALELRRDAFARQRLAAIGEVSARIVHQSRHQVGLMGWSIHRLRGLLGNAAPTDIAAFRQELDALSDAKDRLSDMLTAELLHEQASDDLESPTRGGAAGNPAGSFAGTPRGSATVRQVVDAVLDELGGEASREGVRLGSVVALPDDAPLPSASRQLHDVLFNLVDNAIDAAVAAVEVRIERPAGDAVAILVTDDGPGLATDDERRAFEPFFTTKGDGTGMGLAIADALVGDLGGELRYERRDGQTRFVVTIPTPGP